MYILSGFSIFENHNQQPASSHKAGTSSMSLAIIGAALLVFCTIAYAWSIGVMSDEDLHAPVPFQKRKDLYRKRRDEFRNDPEAMAELKEWKALNDDVDYKKL